MNPTPESSKKRKSSKKKDLKSEYCDPDIEELLVKGRQVGDGAPAEEQNEVKKEEGEELLTKNTNLHNGLYLNIKIDLLSVGLFSVALASRLHNITEPRHIVFDEVHYGRYVSSYAKKVFFFDREPPLGKLLIFGASQFAGYDGNYTFDRIGSMYTSSVPVFALRMVPAIAGAALVPLAYHLMLLLSLNRCTALLAALLVFCDNAFLTQSRFMLMESMLIMFSLLGLAFTLLSVRSKSTLASYGFLLLASITLGCCISIKYSGVYSWMVCAGVVWQRAWRGVKLARSWLSLALGAAARSLVLLVPPLLIYVALFYVHLALLPRAGPHDSVMTSAFQASLEGGLAAVTHGQPVRVAHGSQVTLRHAHGRMCWLHSHQHVYPLRYDDRRGSSHQQQVTCYSFKDVNNWWVVKRPGVSELSVSSPADAVRHGDEVQLLHGLTSRALNSHDVAAPLTPHAQEVSCYIDYNVSMPAQNLWRVEIVNRETDDAYWDSIRSQVRLIHVGTGAALRYSGRQLPPWGFHQHEVVADRNVRHQDALWNVEEHRYTTTDDKSERQRQLVEAEMLPLGRTRLGFWDKFAELQHKMWAGGQDAPPSHMFASEPLDWPTHHRTLAYWLSNNTNAQIHLAGNVAAWWSGSAALLVYAALSCVYAARARRRIRDLPPHIHEPFHEAGSVLLGAYLMHYLPYFFVERTLFLHHYLPAYMFKLLLLALTVQHLFQVCTLLSKHGRLYATTLLLTWAYWVVRTHLRLLPLSLGTPALSTHDLLALRYRQSWDFILHRQY